MKVPTALNSVPKLSCCTESLNLGAPNWMSISACHWEGTSVEAQIKSSSDGLNASSALMQEMIISMTLGNESHGTVTIS